MNANELDMDRILAEYQKFQELHPSYSEIIIISPNGGLEYCSHKDFCSEEDVKALFDAWMNHGPAAVLSGDRYPILSWEELQFAARNVRGKGALVGCKTKTHRYVLIHLNPNAKEAPTTAAIKLNRWSWDVI